MSDFENSAEQAAERRALVLKARDAWIARLIDLSRRNNLLYYRETKMGTLTLEALAEDAESLTALLAGEPVPVLDMVPGLRSARSPTEEQRQLATVALAKLREIQRRALANLEEKGLDTLYLAIGMATWNSTDGGREPQAPVLLVPVAIEQRGRESARPCLRRIGDVQVNPVLLYVLETNYGVKVDAEAVLAELPNADLGEETVRQPLSLSRVFFPVMAARAVPGFAIFHTAVLSNFSYQKMAMVRDLLENAETLIANQLIAALAGHMPARTEIARSAVEVEPRELDEVPPTDEHLVMDADSSQQVAIRQVLAGQHAVIQGPPGTGKSQTITNLVSELAARGKRVLFVAEKRAALEVVLKRLAENGLEHLALDLHGAALSKKEVAARLRTALEHVSNAFPVRTNGLHEQFEDRRARVAAHPKRLHATRSPSGRSAFDLQGQLLRLASARTGVRWRGPALERLVPDAVRKIHDLLIELGGFEDLFLGTSPSAWADAALDKGDDVSTAVDLAGRLAHELLPDVESEIARLCSETGLPEPGTLGQLRRAAALIQEIARYRELYGDEAYGSDLQQLTVALGPAAKGSVARAWAFLTDGDYRGARRTLRARRASKAGAAILLSEARAAVEHQRQWGLLGGGDAPVAPEAPERLGRALEAFGQALADLDALIGQETRPDVPWDELRARIRALAADTATAHRIPPFRQVRRALEGEGIGPLLREIEERAAPASTWGHLFDYAYYASCLDKARAEDPDLAGFSGRAHDQYVADFKALDEARIALARDRVRRLHAERATAAMNRFPEQDALVRREAGKKSRHLPLRKLLQEAPDVLTALCPCWMASPLSVSQLLAGDRQYFDVVIFDEASQVPPEDSIPAIMRAKQAVVAGDRHQLPPTPFFAEHGFAEDDDTATAGFESLLDVMASFAPSTMLEWHYRSLDERLIAFSNAHIYDGRLVTFPGPAGEGSLTHEFVDQPDGYDGQEESADLEVRRVVDLVLAHAEQRPKETLGVITMGLKHARRIEAALDAALRDRPDLDDFFDLERHERFFVKSIERVQGDERDAIILSVGYGKDRSGRLPYRFGPLLQEGGERRLNVAITRARRRMTLVSSFTHHDMDPSRSSARGVELLRFYLQYAATHGRLLQDVSVTKVDLNSFEADVLDTLKAAGIPVIPQLGASRYRIDLAAQHRDRPGEFVLAIECDGATYHSSPTARDRDRLRQQHLEALGWRFHRIWSADWFTRKEDEVRRVVEAYERALLGSGSDREGQSSTVTPPRATDPLAVRAPQRGPRPPVPVRERIGDYHPNEIDALVAWVVSDGRLRTDDQIVEECVAELGFKKRGKRIEAAIRESLKRIRRRQKEASKGRPA